MKKKYVAIIAVALLAIISGVIFFTNRGEEKEYFKDVEGSILKYEDVEEGTRIYISTGGNSRVVLITDETIFSTDEEEKYIDDQVTGVRVFAHCVFTSEIDGAYPVELFSLMEPEIVEYETEYKDYTESETGDEDNTEHIGVWTVDRIEVALPETFSSVFESEGDTKQVSYRYNFQEREDNVDLADVSMEILLAIDGKEYSIIVEGEVVREECNNGVAIWSGPLSGTTVINDLEYQATVGFVKFDGEKGIYASLSLEYIGDVNKATLIGFGNEMINKKFMAILQED